MNELVFIDGSLYDDDNENTKREDRKVFFCRYQGIGWESGRTHSVVFTDKNIPRNGIEVHIVDLEYGKLRRCYPAPPHIINGDDNVWDAIDDTETVLNNK